MAGERCWRVHYLVTMDPEYWDRDEHFEWIKRVLENPNMDLISIEEVDCQHE